MLFAVVFAALLSAVSLADAEDVLTVNYPPSSRPGELAVEATYRLWILPGVKRVRAVIVHQHGCGEGAERGGETAADDLRWRRGTTRRLWGRATTNPEGGYKTAPPDAMGRKVILRAIPSTALASSGYCLANPGREYLVYLPAGGKVSLDLTGATGKLSVEWMNPADGKITPGNAVEGGKRIELSQPFAGPAVLFVWRR